MDKSSWRQLRLRSKDSFHSLGTRVCGKEAPKGNKSTGDKVTLRWPGSGVTGMADPFGDLVLPAPSPVPMTQGDNGGNDDENSFPRLDVHVLSDELQN